MVYVRDYKRANGTNVAGYYRSPPSKSTTAANAYNSAGVTYSSPAASSRWPTSAKTAHVPGYMESNGTCHQMQRTRPSPRMAIKPSQLMPVLPTSSAQRSAATPLTTDTQITSKHTKPESTRR